MPYVKISSFDSLLKVIEMGRVVHGESQTNESSLIRKESKRELYPCEKMHEGPNDSNSTRINVIFEIVLDGEKFLVLPHTPVNFVAHHNWCQILLRQQRPTYRRDTP